MTLLTKIHNTVRTNPTLGRLVLRAIPDIRWRVNVPEIGPMVISLRRNRSYWLRPALAHETFMLNALGRIVRPGDVVYDAGANIGLYVRVLLQMFGAGRVVAFEPMQENLAYLRQNVALASGRDRVQVLPVALADYDGHDKFQTDDLSSATGTLDVISAGGASEGRKQYGLPPATVMVQVAQLNTLLESGTLPIPNVIKIDVEGAEERVLRGASRMIERHSPNLAIELHGADPARSVVKYLKSAGYYIFGELRVGGDPVYSEIDLSNLEKITGLYSLHFCVASRDRELLARSLR